MVDVQGSCDERFQAVADGLGLLLAGGDVGGSVAVLVDGEPVVDVWGGFADADRTLPWRRDTITDLWSVTKTMTALVALLLADRGELDLDAPVARYWPEFARAGKQAVLVRHLLSHSAGLPDWVGPVDQLYDWAAVTSRLASLPPQWEPGTESGYHSLTQGFLVGEVVRRVTGLSVGQVFAQQVAGPLGADLHLGLPAAHDHRVARTVPPPGHDEDYAAAAAVGAALPAGVEPVRVRDGNSVAWRRAQIPAASGFGNARSVAEVQSLLACAGTSAGVRVLSPAGCEVAGQVQVDGVDRVLGVRTSWGLGYALFGSALGWGGWGGSLVLVDPAARMVVAYVTNQMREPGDDDRGLGLAVAAHDGRAPG
ncbi:serine hydrolase domain-containing protein [Jannaschia sp. R86511]|uniref:serine hydrolase domain-containing protein n=1 Tax=Jannaschia sp. R86511 TaxID=3093853 RepID=UPI0036D2FC07